MADALATLSFMWDKLIGIVMKPLVIIKNTLRVLARNYASHDGVLYKRMLNGIQLRCLKKDEANEVMREIHAGVYGSYMNGIILAKKIVR